MVQERVRVVVEDRRDDDVKWLALTIRQALLMIVRAIEKRYDLRSQ